jgi:hypothetical protein
MNTTTHFPNTADTQIRAERENRVITKLTNEKWKLIEGTPFESKDDLIHRIWGMHVNRLAIMEVLLNKIP